MKIQRIGSVAPTRTIAGGLLLAMLVAAFLLLANGPQRASSAGTNDSFAKPTFFASPHNQSTAGATLESGEPQPCGSTGATVWFTTSNDFDTNVTLNTIGSDFNTVLAVYTGSSLTNLKNIACNDDFSGLGDKSQVSFFMRAGVVYRIQAGGFGGGSGQLQLNTLSTTPKTGIPTLMNYQGRLTNPTTGNPVADGNYNLTFRIFDGAAGGTQLWTETQKVAVTGGLFNVLLGSNTALTPGVFNGNTRFLEVQVSGDPAMTPRQRLASVPYALKADGLLGPQNATLVNSGGVWVSNVALSSEVVNVKSGAFSQLEVDDRDGSGQWIVFNSGDLLRLYTNGADRVTFDSSGNVTANAYLLSSNRNLKANFAAVDEQALLQRLATIPIESWTFKDDELATRHIGPTAQDFSAALAALGVSTDDKTINLTDANGVALASIQALYEQVQEKDARIDALEARLTAVEDGTGVDGPAQAANASSGSDSWVLLTVVPLSVLFGLALAGLLGGWAVARRRA